RDVEVTLEAQHAKEDCARRAVLHDEDARGAAAQRVIDEPGNGRAVSGTGEAVGEPPVLERVGGGPSPLRDVGENRDGGRQARRRLHGIPMRTRIAKIAHISSSTSAPTAKARKRRGTRLEVTWT